ncbi:zinc finger protein 91-like isoform X6 [Coccinella septempunctata]|uniref:zinc finger protein 91-like isoform X6 n=1 Tax=Coccinella septempunctata TaxID=41139 RepID=UPI001D088DED|nr:zinc finger protein 91-like isoform X6 [Coccinella septempunctata]
MINSSDILQLCRLCLVEDKVNHPIFEESDDLRSISLKISSCLPVSIHKDDSLPKKICDTCSTKLDSFYQFWSESANAEKQLLQWVDKNKTSKQQADQSRKMETTEVKKELEDTVDPIDMTSEAQTYILQQQQLPYTSSAPNDSLNTSESEEPAAKRPRRASAVKALQHMGSEDEDDAELAADNYAKTESDDSDKEEEDEDSNYQENPSTTSVEDQPGPSGMSKKKMVLDDTPYYEYIPAMYFLDGVKIKEEYPDIREDHRGIKEELEDSDTTETIYIINSEYDPDIFIKTEPDDTDFFNSNSSVSGRRRRRRISNNDETERTGLCHVCGKTVSRMTPHMRRHNMSYKCKRCSTGFSSMRELDKHMQEHENTIYCCNNCHCCFSTPLDLSRHQVKHFNEYRCVFCEFSTGHLSVITAHLDRHEKTLVYECDECGRGFSTEYLMKTHKQIHSGIKRYQCEFCPKKFATENYKNCHMKYNHSEELTGVKKIYKCPVCYREFSFEKSLTRHLSVIHNIGESKKVECPICSKVIANSFNLKMHMSVHTGEKHHVCELCGKAFRDRGHLKRHNKVHLKRGEEMFL